MARKPKFTDEQLMDLADEIKAKYKGKALTPSLLEKETGIGRMTWTRRISDYLDELNNPLIRDIGISSSDNVLFPNIETIFERHGYDPGSHVKLINALHELELLLQDFYNEKEKYKEKAEKYDELKDVMDEKDQKIRRLREQKLHYEELYNTIVVSSLEPHMRQRLGIMEDIIDFEQHKKRYEELNGLQSHFPNIEDDSDKQTKEKLQEIENEYEID